MTAIAAKEHRIQIPAITGLRAVAVFLVILYHSGIEWVPGGLGVTFFFVISGYLITWLLLDENDRNGTVSLKRFYVRRALRIFPAFYVYVAVVCFELVVRGKSIDRGQLIASVLYVSNYYQALWGDPNTALSHTWSLGIEEQFYVMWPLVFRLFRQRLETLTPIVAIIIVAVWIYRAILKFVFHVWQGYLFEAFDTRIDNILVGCLLALICWRFPQVVKKALGRCGLAWMPCTMGSLLLSVILESRFGSDYRDVVGLMINPVLCALMIRLLIDLNNSPGVRWLNSRPARYLGTISYSLYLYQQLVLGPARKVVSFLPFPMQVFFSSVLLVVIAGCSYNLIERPFLRIKSRRFSI